MLRKKFAVLVLLAAAAVTSAAPASADGPKNQQEAAVCSQLLGSFMPGLVPTQSLCSVNHSGTQSGGAGDGQAQTGEVEPAPTWDV